MASASVVTTGNTGFLLPAGSFQGTATYSFLRNDLPKNDSELYFQVQREVQQSLFRYGASYLHLSAMQTPRNKPSVWTCANNMHRYMTLALCSWC